MLRLFVSCDLEDAKTIEKLVNFQRRVFGDMEGLKLVEPQNLHFTLAFLGEQKEDELQKIKRALDELQFEPIKVELRGIGGFPSLRNPRVVVLEVRRGREQLEELAKNTRLLLDSVSVWYDKKPFVPHITLARVKTPTRRLSETLMLNMDEEFGEVQLTHVRLKKSDLKPTGPVYTTLHEVKAKSL